ncbi:hypothetical protein FOA52_015309 [Chlamydomonas sp. UWO 241]|nr:hypothetical protein FOA52_015309 [Chlamydomonas sp. UWO 241]
MRAQVDAAVMAVESPGADFTSHELERALLRWPGVRDLVLSMSSTYDQTLVPRSAAKLALLSSLTIHQVPFAPGACASLVFPEVSSSVAATLQVIDISCCFCLISIDAICSCVQLRCLRMPHCGHMPDLSPLAACSQLEELWMAGNATHIELAEQCLERRQAGDLSIASHPQLLELAARAERRQI